MKKSLYLILLLIAPMLSQAQSSGYCNTKAPRSNVWIQKVAIGNWAFVSGGNGGYLYNADPKLTLEADTIYPVQLTIGGYPRVQDTTYWRIWIDLNRDKDFEDEGEQIMQTKSVYKGLAKGTVKLPRIFDAGAYVMRISLSKGKFSSACGDNGSTAIETEDYLLQVNPAYRCATPVVQNIRVQNIKYNRAILFAVGLKASKYNWHLERIDGSYAQKYTSLGVDSFQLENLQDDVNYKIRLQIECEQGESRWSDFVFFKTLSKKTDCTTLGKSDISIVQTTVYNAEVQCIDSSIQQIEWRYRKLGENNWNYGYTQKKGILRISTPLGGSTYEIQARPYCNILSNWGDWSETIYAEMDECVFPEEKDLVFVTLFTFFPDLHVSINFFGQRFEPFRFQWFYRELGSQNWVDTITAKTYNTNILNLKPSTTYEVRIDLHCGARSVSFIKKVETPETCVNFKPSQVSVGAVYDSSAVVAVSLDQRRTLEFRYRKQGQSDYTILRQTRSVITGLEPNTAYEASVRVVCEDSIPNWSPSVFFTTKSCSLPLTGELALIQMHRLDSARFEAVFFKFSDSQILEFIWRYKEKDKKVWSTLPASGNSQFTLKPLLQNATYDIQATVRCPNNPLDSFLLFTTFTAAQEQCTQKPDTTLVRIWFTPGYAHPTLQFSLPKEYKYDFRVKAEEDANYKSYFSNFSGDYNITFSIYPGTNDFQYRVICPNGNISPWSKTIKIIRPKGIVEDLSPTSNSQSPAMILESRLQVPRLLISPNPTTGRLRIVLPQQMNTSHQESLIEVFNAAGQRVLMDKTAWSTGAEFSINLSAQPQGLYLLRVQSGKQVFAEKIILRASY